MKNVVTVKKNKAHRAGLWFFLVLVVCAAVAVCLLWAPFVQAFLLFVPIILCVFFMALYYEVWQLSFSQKEISLKRLFFMMRTYSYAQISDAYTTYSVSLRGEHICLTFSDGKRIVFLLNDENADKAKRILMSHHSLRAPKW
ncbi:MAG: hypothetical protein J6J62_02250 [Oscillospiraceae bacterium]|nr:hypothetical protein [Oscillospiraceae bacterium]